MRGTGRQLGAGQVVTIITIITIITNQPAPGQKLILTLNRNCFILGRWAQLVTSPCGLVRCSGKTQDCPNSNWIMTKENAFHFYGQYFGCISILQLAFPIAYDSRSWKSNEMCRAQLKTSTLFRYIGSVEKTVSQLPVPVTRMLWHRKSL